MDTKHTPTPWRLEKVHGNIDYSEMYPLVIPGYEGFTRAGWRVPASVYSPGRQAQVDADATFIVCAVNAHEGLVEALQLLFEDWQTLTNQDYNEGNKDVEQLDRKARAALAQARGQT